MKTTASDPVQRHRKEEPGRRRRFWFGRTLRRMTDDSGPPVLKHGKPAERASTSIPDDAPTHAVTSPLPRSSRASGNSAYGSDRKGARGRGRHSWKDCRTTSARKQTTRYVSETRQPSWNVIDIVSAEVVYDDHQESYRNLQINGKPTKKAAGGIGRLVHRRIRHHPGESVSRLQPLPTSSTRKTTPSRIASASVFDFKVLRVRSNWQDLDARTVHSARVSEARSGSTSRPGRCCVSRCRPKRFPRRFLRSRSKPRWTTTPSRLGTADKFLLPVHAEALSCWRGSNECQRNVIEFRNYHKFTGESNHQVLRVRNRSNPEQRPVLLGKLHRFHVRLPETCAWLRRRRVAGRSRASRISYSNSTTRRLALATQVFTAISSS